MTRKLYLVLMIVLCSVSICFPMGGGGGGASQKTHRGFQGVITDQDGNTLKDVEITLITINGSSMTKVKGDGDVEQKSLSTSSGKNGRYRFIAVRHGQYRVRISRNGYQTLEKLIEFKRG